MGKKRGGLERVTISHIQGGREVSSVTLTGAEFTRATKVEPISSAVRAAMERHNGPAQGQKREKDGAHVVAREIAVVGQTVRSRDGNTFTVVARSADRATIYGRGGPGNKLHTIRVSDGQARCIER